MPRRIRLGVLFGGQSDEHEVSVSSARSLVEAVSDTFDVVPIGITRDGSWLIGTNPLELPGPRVIGGQSGGTPILADVSQRRLVSSDGSKQEFEAIDVIFPLLHGPFGEDGTVQGLLELTGIPYVGAGVLASAVGMDKAVMKALFAHAGLPIGRYEVLRAKQFATRSEELVKDVERKLGFPVFVKPARLGSSVGISKASTVDELWGAISEAIRHDSKVVVEEMIYGREVECGLLGDDDPSVTVFGEIVPKHAFYDYEAKYTAGLAELIIPASITAKQCAAMSSIAVAAFRAIDAEGMARVDFFLEKSTGRPVLNEINTIPGFAPTSMYPKLWEASGLPYDQLVKRLVELALARSRVDRREWRP